MTSRRSVSRRFSAHGDARSARISSRRENFRGRSRWTRHVARYACTCASTKAAASARWCGARSASREIFTHCEILFAPSQLSAQTPGSRPNERTLPGESCSPLTPRSQCSWGTCPPRVSAMVSAASCLARTPTPSHSNSPRGEFAGQRHDIRRPTPAPAALVRAAAVPG